MSPRRRKPNQDLFARMAEKFSDEHGVDTGTMFRSPGLRVDGKVFAFLGHDGGLIVKLPEDRARLLVDEGTAERVTMGTRSMREWVAFPAQADEAATLALWQRMARQARTYVGSLGDAS
ncbi:hypothetical protein [Yinghuangia sp. YIM S09857]|uniref:hypothetical protein n=1 Tax=Yinghuangia sp. YIM S09857 TaxID=3436929 RepID=UPI003F530277